jgi:hypothetical protein
MGGHPRHDRIRDGRDRLVRRFDQWHRIGCGFHPSHCPGRNGGTITLGGAASNAWEVWAGAAGDKIKIRPGGCLMLTAPDATGLVAATNADQLLITNDAAATASYSIFLMGSQA